MIDPQLLKLIISSKHRERLNTHLTQREVLKEHNSDFADPARLGAKLAKNTFYKNFVKKDFTGRKKHITDPIDLF